MAQQPVQVSFSKQSLGDGRFVLQVKAIAAKGIQILSQQKLTGDFADVHTTVVFDSTVKAYVKDSVQEITKPVQVVSKALGGITVPVFTDSAVWQQTIQLPPGDSTFRITGELSYYYINNESIDNASERISMQFKREEVAPAKPVQERKYADEPLWLTLLKGIGAGFLGFLTPCVYALVPVTVSIFLKRSKTPAQGKTNALFYAFSIIAIYTIVGILAATVLPKNALNNLSTNWIFNLFIFALFVIFGISFLGAFDINLPLSWANKIDTKANAKSYGGIFFMALTLAIVSFSCTGNFIALLIALGSPVGKVVGLFGFGLGLALPFAIFAFAPSLLTTLTKSGGWQNALKVTLGFLELALALKFLSNADLDRGWRILDREVFLVLWIVIFVLLGIYLLGKLRFSHDSEMPKNDFGLTYIPIPRLFLAITSFAFAVYLIPGLWGAPLKGVSAFVPPMGTQDFISGRGSNGNTTHAGNNAALPPVKHAKELKKYEPAAAIENNLTVYYDYNEALAAAKALNKPLMLDFTGIQCVNCREFEGKIWIDAGVGQRMKNDFVVASLFTDYNEELNDEEKSFSKLLGAKIETVGDKYEDLQLQLIGSAGQPNYVFVDGNGKLLADKGYGYDPTTGAKEFIQHLDAVKARFAAGK